MVEPRQPLHAWQLGRGSAIVLLHGGLSNGQLAWERTARALAQHHTVVVVDRRGHGQSPREPRPYTIASDALDALAICDALELPTFHLLGHSYGAIVAYEVAARAPDRLRSLHLIEPPMLALAPHVPEVAGLIAAARDLWRRAAQLPRSSRAASFLAMVAGEDFAQRVQTWPVWSQLVAEAERLPHEQNPAEYVPARPERLPLTVPITVYTGGHSHPALRVIAEHLAAAIPSARLVHFPEAYHDVHKMGLPFERVLLGETGGRA